MIKTVIQCFVMCQNEELWFVMYLQKLIILYRVIMKQQKYKEDTITGWANQGDTNYDAIMLNNILIRKTTATALPQISYTRNKTQMQHQEINKNRQLALGRGRFNHKSNHILLKMKTQKTQGCYNQMHQKLPSDYQNKQFCVNQLQLISNDTPHQLHIIDKNKKNTIRRSQINQDSINIRKTIQSDKKEQESVVFSKTMKARTKNIKSQDVIHNAVDLIEQSKKSQSRLFVKLSNLQMAGQKKQLRYDYIQKMSQNQFKIEQHQNVIQKRKKRNEYKIRVNSIDKMNEKLKTTFTKKDIFNQNRRKMSRSDNIQFNDQVIFQNNSIVVSKQIMTNPFLYSKIQIMKQPTKYPLVFK